MTTQRAGKRRLPAEAQDALALGGRGDCEHVAGGEPAQVLLHDRGVDPLQDVAA